jgi:hypothetical protein
VKKINLSNLFFHLALPVLGTAITISAILYQNYSMITESSFVKNVTTVDDSAVCEAMLREDKVLSLLFTGEVTDFSNLPNLFSTAAINSGIRVEIDTAGGVGIVTKDVGEADGITGFVAGQIQENKTFEIEILFSFRKYITARVDKSSWTRVDRELNPECNKVLLGGGFSTERTTKGALRVEVGEYASDVFTKRRNWFIQLGMSLILLGVVFTFRRLDSILNDLKELEPKLD